MKKLFVLSMLVLSQSAFALDLEVAPLALKAKVGVVGLQGSVNGLQAIVFTGRVAEKIARAAGHAFDRGSEMIIATGEEASQLVLETIDVAATTGENAVVTTVAFAEAAVQMTTDGLQTGRARFLNPGPRPSEKVLEVLSIIGTIVATPVLWIAEGGMRVLEVGARAFDFVACGVLGWFGYECQW